MYSAFLILLQNNLWCLEQVLVELLFLLPLLGGRVDGEKITINFPVADNDISGPLLFDISGFFLLLRAATLRQKFTTEISCAFVIF